MLWITIVEWLARLIFLVLIILSIWSVTIMIERKRFFKNINYNKKKWIDLLKSKQLRDFQKNENDLMTEMINALIPFNSNEKIEKGFDVFILELKTELEKGLPILGTLGSTTPFIGLLGTILGIIVSFGALSNGSGDMNAVMLSLAEALILTAVGLIVAIPAVIGFNYFSRKARVVMTDFLVIKDLYIAYKD
jgi:biopolymer transport protein ExbB/TolQ